MTNTEYAAKIESLSVFATASNSHRSRTGYMAPITHFQYAEVIGRLARMAAHSDRMAAIAGPALSKINLHGDRAQVCSAVFDSFAETLGGTFYDVALAASPAPGRYSDHHRPFTLAEKVLAFAYAQVAVAGLTGSTSGYGWALEAVADDLDLTLPLFF